MKKQTRFQLECENEKLRLEKADLMRSVEVLRKEVQSFDRDRGAALLRMSNAEKDLEACRRDLAQRVKERDALAWSYCEKVLHISPKA